MSAIKRVSNLQQLLMKRSFSQKSSSTSPTNGTKTNGNAQINANVPGLSSYVITKKSGSLGPGASQNGVYKVPEYYSYDRFSYSGAELEMAKYRCPQPSALKGNK